MATEPAAVSRHTRDAGGRAAAPAAFAVTVPPGLPALPVPADNPMTAEKIELGKMLYFDKRLSKDGTVSCATCHDPKMAWAEHDPTSTGIGGQVGGANSPTVINAAYATEQFWDGRAASLEAQAVGPMENPIEMGHSLAELVSQLNDDPRLQRTIPEGLWHGRDGGRDGQGHRRVRTHRAQRQFALRQVPGRRQDGAQRGPDPRPETVRRRRLLVLPHAAVVQQLQVLQRRRRHRTRTHRTRAARP